MKDIEQKMNQHTNKCELFYRTLILVFLLNSNQPLASELEMVLIPAGSYLMGSNIEGDQQPIHLVYVSSFYIDQLETTQRNYEKLMGYNPSRFKGPDLPVENVDWFEANNYCKKIGKRLPTEAEWEKAARSKTKTNYYLGNKIDSKYAWYNKNSNRKTHPVGKKKPNSYGLFDMSGNVWEWVSDWFDSNYYKFSPFTDPKGPKVGEFKTLKGGSWSNNASYLNLGYRMVYGPEGKDEYIGFRCAK